MSGKVKEFNDSGFKGDISSGVVLVDFWAPWCGPCRMQGPILDKVAEGIGEKAKVGKLNVDDNGITATEFGVSSIPTLILFKDGKEHKRFVGVQNEQVLVKAIESAI